MDFDEREELIELYEKYGAFLTNAQRTAFNLRYIEDYSLAEAADELSVTRQAVNDAVKKAEKKLRKLEEKMNSN